MEIIDQGDLLDEMPPDHRSGFVAVVGRPNVGKSTLMNALLGQKIAIVSARPQTTRNRISGILTLDDMQVIFIDTPGIHQPEHNLGRYMVDQALSSLPDADLVVWVTDVSKRPHDDDVRVAELLAGQVLPVILVMNKIDATPPDHLIENSAALRDLVPMVVADIAISALRDQGLEALRDLLWQHLPLGPRYFPPDQVTEVQERFLAAELVREQALNLLREEVPHAIAVEIEEFSHRSNGVVYIAARVFVERDSQKGILLGKGGSMLKRIGSAARREIETMMEAPVFLDLHVAVKTQWRRNQADLRSLGYAIRDA